MKATEHGWWGGGTALVADSWRNIAISPITHGQKAFSSWLLLQSHA